MAFLADFAQVNLKFCFLVFGAVEVWPLEQLPPFCCCGISTAPLCTTRSQATCSDWSGLQLSGRTWENMGEQYCRGAPARGTIETVEAGRDVPRPKPFKSSVDMFFPGFLAYTGSRLSIWIFYGVYLYIAWLDDAWWNSTCTDTDHRVMSTYSIVSEIGWFSSFVLPPCCGLTLPKCRL